MQSINRYGSKTINVGANSIWVKLGYLSNCVSGSRMEIKIMSGVAYNTNSNGYYDGETTETTIINVVIANNQHTDTQNIRFAWCNNNDTSALGDTITKVGFHEKSEKNYDLYVYFKNAWQNCSVSCELNNNASPLILYDTFVGVIPPLTEFYSQESTTMQMNINKLKTKFINDITETEFSCLDGINGNIQAQINNSDTNITNINYELTNISYDAVEDETTITSDLICDSIIPTGNNLKIGKDYISNYNYIEFSKPSHENIKIKSDIIEIDGSLNATREICGVFGIDGSNKDFTMFPFYFSTDDINKVNSKNNENALIDNSSFPSSNPDVTSGMGYYGQLDCDNSIDYFLVLPNYAVVGYYGLNHGGGVNLCYYNKTSSAQVVKGATANATSSVKIYYNNVEIL